MYKEDYSYFVENGASVHAIGRPYVASQYYSYLVSSH